MLLLLCQNYNFTYIDKTSKPVNNLGLFLDQAMFPNDNGARLGYYNGTGMNNGASTNSNITS